MKSCEEMNEYTKEQVDEYFAKNPAKREVHEWIKNQDGNIAIYQDYESAIKFRNLLGEDGYDYKMEEIEWGCYYKIAIVNCS